MQKTNYQKHNFSSAKQQKNLNKVQITQITCVIICVSTNVEHSFNQASGSALQLSQNLKTQKRVQLLIDCEGTERDTVSKR